MTTHTRSRGEGTVKGNGYIQVKLAGHPLAGAHDFVYMHRVVLYDAIGPGSHECHYCGASVTWGENLEAEHLDRDRANNDRANLVPCCIPCNHGQFNRDKEGCPHDHGPYDKVYANGWRYCSKCKIDKERRRRARKVG